MNIVSIGFKVQIVFIFFLYCPVLYAEDWIFNIDHNVVNRAKFDTENERDIIELYQNNKLITKIPSFDEDGGNRVKNILTRYDENNILRVITRFPDRGHYKIYYDIGFNKNRNLFMLNKVSFEIQEWSSQTDVSTIYCYHQINQELNELMNDDWFHKIRPTYYGWEDGTVKGNCIVSKKVVGYENSYNITMKSHLFDKPDINNMTNMYLIKGDIVDLVRSQNNFYEINYTTKKNKIIKKWLHCSAIDACIKD